MATSETPSHLLLREMLLDYCFKDEHGPGELKEWVLMFNDRDAGDKYIGGKILAKSNIGAKVATIDLVTEIYREYPGFNGTTEWEKIETRLRYLYLENIQLYDHSISNISDIQWSDRYIWIISDMLETILLDEESDYYFIDFSEIKTVTPFQDALVKSAKFQ